MADTNEVGELVLAGVPIGNIGDASSRLGSVLKSADIIAAEDTRKLRRLLSDLGLQTDAQIVSYYDQVENDRLPQLLSALAAGKQVVVVTDSGMPTVSDPGFKIGQAVAAAGGRITVVPGPSAVTTALAISGLPTDRFCFEGFLSRKSGERNRQLQLLAHEPRTMVFFEAPHRVFETVTAMAEAFGEDRPAVMCRELTKTYQEVVRGNLADLVARCSAEVLGEVTLVIQGISARAAATSAELLAAVAIRESAGLDRKSAIAEVAQEFGVAKRELFDLVVAAKHNRA